MAPAAERTFEQMPVPENGWRSRPGRGFSELVPIPRRFYSARTVLRRFVSGDASVLLQLMQRNRVWLRPFTPEVPIDLSATDVLKQIRQEHAEARTGKRLDMAIVDGENAGLIGRISLIQVCWGVQLSAGIGYWIAKEHAGKGLGREAVATMLSFAFEETSLNRIWASVRPENVQSRHLLDRLGFRVEGVHRQELYIDRAWRDMECLSLLREDYDRVADDWIRRGWLGWAG